MPPVTVMIKPVSGACNMCCRYCFYQDEMNHRETACYPVMTEQTLEILIQRSMAYADGTINFIFQGGEPTLIGLSFFEKLIWLQKKYNTRGLHVQNAIQSNGYALSDEMIALFARHSFLVGISLDGCESTHDLFRLDVDGQGTYRKVIQTIRRLQQAGVSYNILCVVNSSVAAQAENVLSAFSDFENLQFIPCMNMLDGKNDTFSLSNEAYAAFLEIVFLYYEKCFFSKHPVRIRQFDNWLGILLGYPPENCAMCGNCSINFLVESNGDVYPCDFYALDEWKLGNVHTHSFRQMLRNPLSNEFCRTSVPDVCRACRWYRLCRNGCRRERDPETNIYRLCEGTQAFFQKYAANLQIIGKRLLS